MTYVTGVNDSEPTYIYIACALCAQLILSKACLDKIRNTASANALQLSVLISSKQELHVIIADIFCAQGID